MFEFLFKYPFPVFARGKFVLMASWPVWIMPGLVLVIAAVIGYLHWRRGTDSFRMRSLAIWSLQCAVVTVLLFLLWQPALSISTLKPQQNIVAVVVDDSRSMAVKDDGRARNEQAAALLNGPLIEELSKRFQVRLYSLSSGLERIGKATELTAARPATHIGSNLKQLMTEAGTLPIGAVVLLSDGSDNSGGIDSSTISEIRRHRIPVHTVGFGRERIERDVEISDVQVAPRALADSRLAAVVTFRQRGFGQRKSKLVMKESGKVLASREVTFKTEAAQQTETLVFNAGLAGAKTLQVTLEPLEGEENVKNNSLTRLVNVEAVKPRILYIEGEPKWEFKFIRRAVEDDRSLQLVTMLRTSQNKVYRQGIAQPKELEEGFPTKVQDLFEYQGIVIGGVEAAYFTTAQQELLKQFVDRRGGGLLFLAGRTGLAEGGYAKSVFSELLPVALPERKTTFFRDPATAELTQAGVDSLVCRLEEDPERNAARWKKLPYLANFQEVGAAKPGAVTLAELTSSGHGKFPMLVTQNYGQGRTAVLATNGTWRWQMLQSTDDMTHEMFWRQLLRWVVTGTRGRVLASTPDQVLYDNGRVPIHVRVKDTNYLAAGDANVEAHILGPDGLSASVPLQPDSVDPGEYSTEWDAPKPGSYMVEVTAKRGQEETGRDVFTFRREDGVAEDFHTEQNRELLEKLAEQTGGRYYKASEAGRLANEIEYSEAGISVRESKELWNMPAIFLLLLMLRGGEWLLRRKWGAV